MVYAEKLYEFETREIKMMTQRKKKFVKRIARASRLVKYDRDIGDGRFNDERLKKWKHDESLGSIARHVVCRHQRVQQSST